MKWDLRWYDAFILVLLACLFFGQISAVWPFTLDDTFISLRYSKNWVSGIGLLWNADNHPVEGYSNFSFVVLGALALLLQGDPVLWLKYAGVIGLLASGIFVFLLSRFWFSIRLSLIPVFYLLYYQGEPIWAVSGLETTCYQALISAAVFCIFYGSGYRFYPKERVKPDSKWLIIAGITLSLAAMTRPEAPAYMVLFFILMCWDNPTVDGRRQWRGIILFCISIIICFVPYFLWRWNYYGYLFPNPIYCKGYVTSTFRNNWEYIHLIWPFFLLAIPACLKAKDKRHYFLWLPSIMYLLLLVNSEPIGTFYNRLFLSAFILLLPLSQQGLSTLLNFYLPERDVGYSLSLFLLSCIVAMAFIPSKNLASLRYFSQNPVKGEALRRELAHWLNDNVAPKNKVVLGDAGFVPYSSSLQFIDSFCLNNVEMAHDSKKLRYENFCQQTLVQKTKIIILTSQITKGVLWYQPSDLCFKKAFKKNKDYKKRIEFSIGDARDSYRYEVYTLF